MAYLSMPKAPSAIGVGITFSANGTLKPRHASGTTPVRIMRERFEGGRWVAYGSVSAKVSNIQGGSAYSAKTKMGKRGVWRIKARYVGTASSAASHSAWNYLYVK